MFRAQKKIPFNLKIENRKSFPILNPIESENLTSLSDKQIFGVFWGIEYHMSLNICPWLNKHISRTKLDSGD